MVMNYHNIYKEGKERICPITGKPYILSWTDHEREGVFNSCANCNDDRFCLPETLRRINNNRKQQQTK